MKKWLKRLNYFLVWWYTLRGFKGGCLPHIQDKRDYQNMTLGWGPVSSIVVRASRFLYQFIQKFNICVFVSGVLALSEQEGIRFVVRPAVALAKKLGHITGDGWSFTRAILNIVVDHGLILLKDLEARGIQDEPGNMSWNEFSRWLPEYDELYRNAIKFPEYSELRSDNQVTDALNKGYVPVTACRWYMSENRPFAPWVMRFVGALLGGHQWRITWRRPVDRLFESGQTFGKEYGDGGKLYFDTPFRKEFYATYIVERLPLSVRVELLKGHWEGKIVRTAGDVRCFLIEAGEKRHIPDMETYWQLVDKHGLHIEVEQDVLDAIPEGQTFTLN